MRAGLVASPEPLEALPEGVVRVRRRWIELEQLLERRPGGLMLAGVEVRPAERLEDRRLARLGPVGALEHDRRLRVVPPVEQRLPALEQLVGGVSGRASGASRTASTSGTVGFDARLGSSRPERIGSAIVKPRGALRTRGTALSPRGTPPGRPAAGAATR